MYDKQVNDGSNLDGDYTLGVNADFNNSTDGNKFFDWLKYFVRDNSDDFIEARIRIHDCFHASDENKPCKIGNVWEL